MDLEIKPPRISIRELIIKGFLTVGQQVFSKDRKYFVTLCEDGNVSDHEEKLSIHKMSAKILGRTNNNGWDYFWTEYNGNFVSINSLRYLANQNNEL